MEIEGELRNYPGILEAAVIGVESLEWGEKIVAVIATQDCLSEE